MLLLKEHFSKYKKQNLQKRLSSPPLPQPPSALVGYSSISLSLIKMAPEKIRLVGPQALIQCWNF
jgi:hypothetical protein